MEPATAANPRYRVPPWIPLITPVGLLLPSIAIAALAPRYFEQMLSTRAGTVALVVLVVSLPATYLPTWRLLHLVAMRGPDRRNFPAALLWAGSLVLGMACLLEPVLAYVFHRL